MRTTCKAIIGPPTILPFFSSVACQLRLPQVHSIFFFVLPLSLSDRAVVPSKQPQSQEVVVSKGRKTHNHLSQVGFLARSPMHRRQ
jgi:hypothetical protein